MTTQTSTRIVEPTDYSQVSTSIGLGDAWHGRSVAEARQFVRDRMERWRFDSSTAEDSVLVTSELVTNAFVHAAGPVWLGVDRRNDAVVISVHDTAPSPVPGVVVAGDESGRGLGIVRHLSRSFGWSRYAHHKVVWAVLASPAAEFGVKET